MCPTFELNGHKRRTKIHDYPIRHTKVVHDVLNKLDGLACAVLDKWFILIHLVNLSMAT
jgi:hypothetical protein